ncbi:MAG: hypothetical protein PXX83_03705 [Candidatus Nitrosotalea sp.]|nr:hypothetical protein [Candidatus Nitrosotalea sp.]
MQFSTIFLVLLVSVLGITIPTGYAVSEQTNACNPHTICAHPGDMLRYNITIRDMNSSQTYNFGAMPDANTINIIQSQEDSNGIQNSTLVLNLKTGFVHSEQNVNAVRPFLEVLASPIDYNQSDTSVTPIVTEFNGFKRTSLVAFHSTENSTSKIVYDIKTGILLEEHSTSIISINGNPEVINFADKLSDTNMINSDSVNTQSQISIPQWVKNTARSWSQGDIQDSEFTNAIQYLISNGIMHIPHGTSGANSAQSIPAWIKQSTGMWAGGQITDNEFVQGIQWLITKGIIQVGN